MLGNLTRLLATIIMLPIFVIFAAEAADLNGTVTHVRDGDTIEIENIAVRLQGVSAPELREPFGRDAKRFMSDLVGGHIISCRLTGEQNYDRLIGICFLAHRDIGAVIVSSGLARDCPRFSGGRYKVYEVHASRQLPLPRYCIR